MLTCLQLLLDLAPEPLTQEPWWVGGGEGVLFNLTARSGVGGEGMGVVL